MPDITKLEVIQVLEHIASQAQCNTCYPKGPMSIRTDICSRHRDPVLIANGAIYGWTHRGGIPNNYLEKEA